MRSAYRQTEDHEACSMRLGDGGGKGPWSDLPLPHEMTLTSPTNTRPKAPNICCARTSSWIRPSTNPISGPEIRSVTACASMWQIKRITNVAAPIRSRRDLRANTARRAHRPAGLDMDAQADRFLVANPTTGSEVAEVSVSMIARRCPKSRSRLPRICTGFARWAESLGTLTCGHGRPAGQLGGNHLANSELRPLHFFEYLYIMYIFTI
jgi:hypothetical protein